VKHMERKAIKGTSDYPAQDFILSLRPRDLALNQSLASPCHWFAYKKQGGAVEYQALPASLLLPTARTTASASARSEDKGNQFELEEYVAFPSAQKAEQEATFGWLKRFQAKIQDSQWQFRPTKDPLRADLAKSAKIQWTKAAGASKTREWIEYFAENRVWISVYATNGDFWWVSCNASEKTVFLALDAILMEENVAKLTLRWVFDCVYGILENKSVELSFMLCTQRGRARVGDLILRSPPPPKAKQAPEKEEFLMK
jgi:hypothetical protein